MADTAPTLGPTPFDDRATLRRAGIVVFAILIASYATFWHGRDWNTSSRLMLVYALGDRGTIKLNGLQTQTRDIAFFAGSYYTDKQPGYSFLTFPIYLVCKAAFRVSPHPLDAKAMTHWPADYWLTLATSGLATALGGVLLMRAAHAMGCRVRTAALVGLSYGLCTPAYVYATLAYGHQVTAVSLLSALLLVASGRGATCAGLLAGFAMSVELSAAPVSALIGLLAVARVVRGDWGVMNLIRFAAGAAVPVAGLLAYNVAAYGSPFDMGYAHHVVPRFRELHGRGNPFGLRPPRLERLLPLLWGEYRGLLVYAPAVLLAPVGWIALASRQKWTLLTGSLGACVLVFLVNLSYPEWTGGWSTGPRLLVTMLPFAMLAGGAALSVNRGRAALFIAFVGLSLCGAVVNLGCQGIGGRLPDTLGTAPLDRPLTTVVWPLWRGDPLPDWWTRDEQGRVHRFDRTVITVINPALDEWPAARQWTRFLPLILVQLVGLGVLMWVTRRRDHAAVVATQPA